MMLKTIIKRVAQWTLLLSLSACANMASGPSGGEKDVVPPSYARSNPAQRATKVNQKRIEIEFNEFLQINDPANKLVVSPPQKPAPSAKVIGKKVIVEMKDSLKPNTTYTLDFTNCIGDYTENNLINNYCYTFSTGDVLDSLVISGVLLDAKTLAPAPNVLVGLYEQYTDTTFKTTPFTRIGRSNENGIFSIKGCAAKQYKIFALEDLNSNYFYDQKGEGVAMLDGELPIPTVSTKLAFDTTYKNISFEREVNGTVETVDTTVIDTIKARNVNVYSPDSVHLLLFHKEVKLQEFNKIERKDRKHFELYLTKYDSSDVKISPVNFEAKDWYVRESSLKNDTVQYWITDTTVMKMDTLQFTVEYLKTDSAENFVTQIDTLQTTLPESYLKQEEKVKKDEEKKREKAEKRGAKAKRTNILTLESKGAQLEIYANYTVVWKSPVANVNMDLVHFLMIQDSLRTPVPFELKQLENKRKFALNAEIKPGSRYALVLDSTAVTDYYGNYNDSLGVILGRKIEDEYGSLRVSPMGVSGDVYVELINSKDVALRTQKVSNGSVFFKYLTPDVYYVRLFVDRNKNGKWDTGDFDTNLQPEEVRYYPKALKVRKGWDMEEDWNVNANSLENQRLPEIKGADDDKKSKKR